MSIELWEKTQWLVITNMASEKNFRSPNFYNGEDMIGDVPQAAVALSTLLQKRGDRI